MNKELLTALLTALTKASKIYPQPNLNDPATREGIARILLDEIEKKGVVKFLVDTNKLMVMNEFTPFYGHSPISFSTAFSITLSTTLE